MKWPLKWLERDLRLAIDILWKAEARGASAEEIAERQEQLRRVEEAYRVRLEAERREREQRERECREVEDFIRENRLHQARYLEVLGVGPRCTPEELRAAYRQKVRACHPDLHGGDGEPLRLLNEAYEALNR